MPTIEPALDDIQQQSRDLTALDSQSERPPTREEVQAAVAKLRANISSLIEYVQQLYNFAILVSAELSPGSAADSWKDLHEKFSGVLVILERTLARHPVLEPETDRELKYSISIVRLIANQADQEYRKYHQTAEEIPESFLAGLEDIRAGRVVDMEQALNEPPPTRS